MNKRERERGKERERERKREVFVLSLSLLSPCSIPVALIWKGTIATHAQAQAQAHAHTHAHTHTRSQCCTAVTHPVRHSLLCSFPLAIKMSVSVQMYVCTEEMCVPTPQGKRGRENLSHLKPHRLGPSHAGMLIFKGKLRMPKWIF